MYEKVPRYICLGKEMGIFSVALLYYIQKYCLRGQNYGKINSKSSDNIVFDVHKILCKCRFELLSLFCQETSWSNVSSVRGQPSQSKSRKEKAVEIIPLSYCCRNL